MPLQHSSQPRIFVDDDIPEFMRAGPSRAILGEAKKYGLLSGKSAISQPPLSIRDESDTLRIDRSARPAKPVTDATDAPHADAPHKEKWDQTFLLTVVLVLIALNTALFVGFTHHTPKAPPRLQLTHALEEEVTPPPSLEERIITYRPEERRAPLPDAQEAAVYHFMPIVP